MIATAEPRVFAFPSDVEGYLLEPVGEMLYRLACRVPEDGLIVELGSYKGRSTICLAQSGRKVWAVDHFLGEPLDVLDDKGHALPDHVAGDYRAAFMANTAPYENVRAIVQPTAFGPAGMPVPGGFIDLLFVDAGHDYESVTADLAAWEPHMRPRGVIVFDDANFPGVARAMADAGGRGWRYLERAFATVAVQRKED